MGIDTPDGGKRKRYKKNSKKKEPMKDVNQVKPQPIVKDEDNAKKLEERHIQHSVEEKAKSDVKNDMVKREKGEIRSIEKKESDLVESPEAVAGVAVKENIQTSVSETLEASTEQASASSLIEMLKHKSEKVRIETLESLLKIGNKSVCYAFASCMKDESFQVRLAALRGLYKFGGDLAVDYLVTALEDTHANVRRRAVIYLGWLRKKELVPYINGALADSSSLVRKVATYTLGDVKDVSAAPHLIKVLDDTDLEVQKGALAALKRITKKSFDSDLSSPEEIHQEMVVKWKEWWQSKNK